MERDEYLEQLLRRRGNGQVKVITGLRRCGKSYLLFTLFRGRLLAEGVPADHIVSLALDDDEHAGLRDPRRLGEYLRERLAGLSGEVYLLLDEIQYCYRVRRPDVDESQVPPEERDALYITFYDVLNGLQRHANVDIYVTGSNSRMLSDDVLTIFRGRGDEVRVHPFSFAEFYRHVGGDRSEALEEYMAFGGMPQAVMERDEQTRRSYLHRLFETVYVRDLVEHSHLEDGELLEGLLDALSSSVGSLTNPLKLSRTLTTALRRPVGSGTVSRHLTALSQAYLFSAARRFDVRGKHYFETPYKLYAEDVGLRNARLNWRQSEPTHLMENILYNELVRRGHAVDVGVVEVESRQGHRETRQHEIDFIVNHGVQRTYIQSAFSLDTPEKSSQELLPFRHCRDAFRKMVVTWGGGRLWQDEEGIFHVGLIPFLLDESILG